MSSHVDELVAKLRGENPNNRLEAVAQFGCLSADAEKAVFALSAAINDRDPWVREFAIVTLGKFASAFFTHLRHSIRGFRVATRRFRSLFAGQSRESKCKGDPHSDDWAAERFKTTAAH